MFRQMQNGVFIGMGKTFFRRILVWQPYRIQVFPWSKNDRKFFRNLQTENMFSILCHTGRESMPPDRKNFKDIINFPVFKTIQRHLVIRNTPDCLDNFDTSLFKHFPDGRLNKRFRKRIPRTRHRLPETGPVRTFYQQDVQFFRVNDDQNRLWNFICHVQNETRER